LERCFSAIKDFVDRPIKDLLILEPNADKQHDLLEWVGKGEVQARAVQTAAEALNILRQRRVDCLVLDPNLPDMSVQHFVEETSREAGLADMPVILYAEKAPDAEKVTSFKELGQRVNLRHATSPETLVDQAALVLHCPFGKLSDANQHILKQLHGKAQSLAGKKVLIVDDDIRNIFALTSMLEWHNMVIVGAETGRDAIRLLQEQPDIDMVLMDIMMPEMDGLDTMREIRKLPIFRNLPIIAVTAKAMKGDREKCIEAGAWDYLSKPVDSEQLLAALRAWLCR
ncbi:MAG TPA: response regulator, partial [Gemmataceae bacterium]|nr:response regulator [Gemmataceae bacterium]